jgi:hypothetical protein
MASKEGVKGNSTNDHAITKGVILSMERMISYREWHSAGHCDGDLSFEAQAHRFLSPAFIIAIHIVR